MAKPYKTVQWILQEVTSFHYAGHYFDTVLKEVIVPLYLWNPCLLSKFIALVAADNLQETSLFRCSMQHIALIFWVLICTATKYQLASVRVLPLPKKKSCFHWPCGCGSWIPVCKCRPSTSTFRPLCHFKLTSLHRLTFTSLFSYSLQQLSPHVRYCVALLAQCILMLVGDCKNDCRKSQ